MLAIVRGADLVARLGGDEFVIAYVPNDPSADHLVQRIDDALSLRSRSHRRWRCRAAMYRVKRSRHRGIRRVMPDSVAR